MPFVKIDCGILDSTLWMDRDARECFVTALLMAQPREFTEAVPQLQVETLKETGFVAPPGWYGFVPAAGVAIVRRAGITDQATGFSALQRLGSPEMESRSPDFEGRRLIRIDGGYLVLNFMKYRDRDYTGAERARRYRDRQKASASHRDDATSHRDDATSRRDTPVTSRKQSAECRVQKAEEETKTKSAKARRDTGVELPDDFALTDAMKQQALSRASDCDVDQAFALFKAHHVARGSKLKRWPSAWVTWIGNFEQFGYPKKRPVNGAKSLAEQYPGYKV